MIEIGEIVIAFLMLGGVIVGALIGYPLGIIVGSIGVFSGIVIFGPIPTFEILYSRVYEILMNYSLLALPLFVFMGSILEVSGIADGLYDALYGAFGKLKGGLAITSVIIGTILAAAVGILGASVTMLTLVALPSMLERGYSKQLASGSIMAGGTLGILIPPSIMLVIYGPMAGLSVGKLFMAAFIPGFLLSALYCVYIAILCIFKPSLGPSIPEDKQLSPLENLKKLFVAMFPPVILIMSVLGTIFLGIAPPTQAAAIGALVTVFMAIAYRKLTLDILNKAMIQTVKITGSVLFVAAMTFFFVGIFIRAGGGEVITRLVLSIPGGRWGILFAILAINFFLGMVMEWIGVVFILVPIFTPIMIKLGFDPLWFALMMCVALQMSFLTPPVAPAIFYMRSAAKDEWGVSTLDMMKGIIPFVGIIIIALIICSIFPEVILWLPSKMLGG
jgi:tripartite ATP-independent transporter DctM subunit